MNKPKHTPGPWWSMSILTEPENVDGLRDDDGGILVTQDKCDEYESDIAYVMGRHVSAPNRTDKETEANANIIAAAPELLEALQELLETCELNMDEMEDGTRKAIRAARDAVRKARGEHVQQ